MTSERKGRRKKTTTATKTTHNLFGREVASKTVRQVTEVEFDFKKLPEPVKRKVRRSGIPQEHFENALAVVGRAYADAQSLWDDRMGSEGLEFRVPTPPDFGHVVSGIKEGQVTVKVLTQLSIDLFAHSDTPQGLISTVSRKIELILGER